jgi:hypothetical protein
MPTPEEIEAAIVASQAFAKQWGLEWRPPTPEEREALRAAMAQAAEASNQSGGLRVVNKPVWLTAFGRGYLKRYYPDVYELLAAKGWPQLSLGAIGPYRFSLAVPGVGADEAPCLHPVFAPGGAPDAPSTVVGRYIESKPEFVPLFVDEFDRDKLAAEFETWWAAKAQQMDAEMAWAAKMHQMDAEMASSPPPAARQPTNQERGWPSADPV